MIYLASPYAHPDKAVRDERSKQVRKHAAELMTKGLIVFSPIAHGVAIKEFLPESLEVCHKFWLKQDASYLFAMREMYVLMLDGWKESKGVQWEIATAKVLNIPVTYVEPTKEDKDE